jgi:hypothetical protein
MIKKNSFKYEELIDCANGKLSDPEKAKKYHKCEEERIKKAEENTITYLYNLFYKLKDQ